jgi:hypothetical protein
LTAQKINSFTCRPNNIKNYVLLNVLAKYFSRGIAKLKGKAFFLWKNSKIWKGDFKEYGSESLSC